MKSLSLPEAYTEAIEKQLQTQGYTLLQPKPLAQAIQKLSNFYLKKEYVKIWDDRDLSAAYLAYFFPLNYLRCIRVIRLCKQIGFFTNISKIIDFGSGCGTFLWALTDEIPDLAKVSILGVEQQSAAKNMFIKKLPNLNFKTQLDTKEVTVNTLVLASYSYNELNSKPSWLREVQKLLIIEPSTRESGRQLMKLRADLLEDQFHVWAPCTHQEHCPLIIHSKSDWCHDRIHVKLPEWFTSIEQHLPMHNKTLTYSYLAMDKVQRPPQALSNYTRVIGDTLYEKGKIRQAICRNSRREFLSWLKRKKPAHALERGLLTQINFKLCQAKANEIRPEQTLEVLALDEPLSL